MRPYRSQLGAGDAAFRGGRFLRVVNKIFLALVLLGAGWIYARGGPGAAFRPKAHLAGRIRGLEAELRFEQGKLGAIQNVQQQMQANAAWQR